MKSLRNLAAVILAILLAASLIAYYSTRDSAAPNPPNKSAAAEQPQVDTSLLRCAVNLAASAATPDEQTEAREAWRLADHELDLRFAAAVRGAEAEALLLPTGPLQQWSNRITQLQ